MTAAESYIILAHVDPEGALEVTGHRGYRDDYRAITKAVPRATACTWRFGDAPEHIAEAKSYAANNDGFWRVYVLQGDDCLEQAKAKVMAEWKRRKETNQC